MSEPATSHPTNPPTDGPPQRLDRRAVPHILHDYDLADRQGTTQRDFARQRGLPHASLQRWLYRRDRLRRQHPEAAFFDSPRRMYWFISPARHPLRQIRPSECSASSSRSIRGA